jgi:hypothetical protein
VMEGIRFFISEALLELASAKALAGPFLVNAETVFGQLRTQLEGLRDEPMTGQFSWNIPSAHPLRTIVSKGEYENGSKGRQVAATLSFLWEVTRVHPKKRKLPAKLFELVGIGSTVVRVFQMNDDDTQGPELAMWRTEVGDEQSPGCHFHVQVLGETEDLPFPKGLSVPRLPSCLVTPMAALEFMLAELFQERWRKHIFTETDALKTWRAIQRERMSRLFSWQSRAASEGNRSPWAALKAAKPPQGIFID